MQPLKSILHLSETILALLNTTLYTYFISQKNHSALHFSVYCTIYQQDKVEWFAGQTFQQPVTNVLHSPPYLPKLSGKKFSLSPS